MEHQGYLPRYFYGGSLSWHRLYNILPFIGYQEVFGESSIKNVSKHRFGVHDGDLFEFVHQKLMQAKQPTFNFIMTLSNHPPYGVPESFISPITFENTPQKIKNKILDKDNFNKRMRALAYADQALGNYMQKAKESPYFKETLFVLTADHSHDMNFRWELEELYKQKKIPLIFYSPELLKITATTNENQGSHLDLPATLLSLISERTSKLKGWGRSLFEEPNNKILFSFHINCLDDVCRTKEQTFVLQKDQYLTLCRETWCFEKSKQLSGIENAFWHSGYNYLFQYRIGGKATPSFK
jgi:phosphoglycerol transferase MdoB-like AlkP superfamily enzyme